MDQMSALKVNMNVLKELTETEKIALKMREDTISLLTEQLLAIASNKRSKQYSALRTAHQDIKKTNSTTIPKYTAMSIAYIAI